MTRVIENGQFRRIVVKSEKCKCGLLRTTVIAKSASSGPIPHNLEHLTSSSVVTDLPTKSLTYITKDK